MSRDYRKVAREFNHDGPGQGCGNLWHEEDLEDGYCPSCVALAALLEEETAQAYKRGLGERYEAIAQSDEFKAAYEGKSLGLGIEPEEDYDG